MKCKSCGTELEEGKTLITDHGEYDLVTTQKGKKFKDIKVRKGWRLWRVSDFEKFSKEQWKELRLDNDLFFIANLPALKGKYAARFFSYSYGAYLYCDRDPQVSSSDLGVRFCRDR